MGVIVNNLMRILGPDVRFEDLPGAVQLAVALSPAARIEPELIRAMRLRALPRLDVSTESELWFGEWVGTRNPFAIALRPQLLPVLRKLLRAQLDGSHPDTPIHQVWPVLATAHSSLSPALRLEEEITELTLTGKDAEKELRRALAGLRAGPRRHGIMDWLYGAWQRLPPEVLDTETGWQLAQLMRQQTDLNHLGHSAAPPHASAATVSQIATAIEQNRELTLTWHRDHLQLGGAATPLSAIVSVPDTEPVLIDEVDDSGNRKRTIRVHKGSSISLVVPDGEFRGQTGDGMIFRVTRPGRASSQPQEWRTRLPSHILSHADHLPTSRPAAVLNKLVGWLTSAHPVAVRFLYGKPGSGKTQLTNALVSHARREGWAIFPKPAADSASLPFFPRGLLVIIDDVRDWSPAATARLVNVAQPQTRVLILGRENGNWWEATDCKLSTVSDAECSQQGLAAAISPADVFDQARTSFKRTLGATSSDTTPSHFTTPKSLNELHMAALLATLAPTLLPAGPEMLARHLLDHEAQEWKVRQEVRSQLAKLLVAATVAHPLPRDTAIQALVDLGIVSTSSQASELLALYDQRYPPVETGVVTPLHPWYLASLMLVCADKGNDCFGLKAGTTQDLIRRMLEQNSTLASNVANTAVMLHCPKALLHYLANEHSALVQAAPDAVLTELARQADAGLIMQLWRRAFAHADPAGRSLGFAAILERVIQLSTQSPQHEQAALRKVLAGHYMDAGLTDRALVTMDEVEQALRPLAARDPHTYQAELATALSDHSRYLLQAAQRQKAVRYATEAVRLSEVLGRLKLSTHQAVLANALTEYSAGLAKQGNEHGALGAITDAIEIYRVLAEVGQNHDAELAMALSAYSGLLIEAARQSEAVAALQEATDRFQRLADEFPAVYDDIHKATSAKLRSARQR